MKIIATSIPTQAPITSERRILIKGVGFSGVMTKYLATWRICFLSHSPNWASFSNAAAFTELARIPEAM